MTITKEFFKERLDFMRWLDEQQKSIEKIFDCDIYGGPMKVFETECNMWKQFFKNRRSYDLFITFSAFYTYVEKCHNLQELTYTWNGKDFFDFYDETIEIKGPATDDNWIDAVWKRICELEEKENESR